MSNKDVDNFNNLNSSNYKQIPKFSLDGLKFNCLCVKVYDGDTITVLAKSPLLFNNELRIYNIRILGIDTPELKGAKSNKEKKFGIEVGCYLRNMILDKMVQIDFKGFDKYGGRTLANVYFNGVDISKHLIELGYAIPYDGTTKQIWFPDEIHKSNSINEN